MGKAFAALIVALMATVAAARVAYEFSVADNESNGRAPWALNSMQFVAWNEQRWTALIRDGAFELTPKNTNNWSRHRKGTIAYLDWDGQPWQARIDGDAFLLAHRGDWSGEVLRADAVRYRDWQDEPQLRTVTQLLR